MNKTFRIEESRVDAAGKRHTDAVYWYFFPMGMLMVGALLKSMFVEAFFVFFAFSWCITFICIYKRKALDLLRIQITDKSIRQTIEASESNALFRFMNARHEGRFGIKGEKELLFQRIDEVVLKRNGDLHLLIRKRALEDSLTYSTSMTLPYELEQFEDVKAFILSHIPARAVVLNKAEGQLTSKGKE